ncbi:C40 family peptidase [Alkalihalobacterium bogoriense]|uniref:C40 family peptidase n=1 Tax=Alkalihalobacterium bogoriense TaxID=246272 RepID=UPI00047B381A|nr:peptidoglycan-binding protein [Alkalihalobacterium bogoriense]
MVMKTDTKGKLLVTSMVLGAAMNVSAQVGATEKNYEEPEKLIKDQTLQMDQKLKFGDKGQQVLHLQGFLSAFQYYKGPHDGMYGLVTMQAVKQYQSAHDLTVDGIVGKETRQHLLTSAETKLASGTLVKSNIKVETNDPNKALISSELSPQLSQEETLSTEHLLQYGDRGEVVKQLQEELKEYGYYEGVDGKFGPKTKQAVLDYQRAHQLQVDGLAGPETIGHLLEAESVIDYATYKETVQVHEVQVNETEVNATTAAQETEPSSSENQTSKQKEKSEPKAEAEPQPKANGSTIATAKDLIGVPYVWGGTTTSGFDCSGFLQYVFKQHGISIPRTVSEIWGASSSVSEPSVGDIVFFTTYKSGPSHAGIYIGDRNFIHAGSSTGVTTSSLDENYWSTRYLGAKRIQ